MTRRRSQRPKASTPAARKRASRDAPARRRAKETAPPDPIEDTLKAEHMLDSVLWRER